MFIFFFLNYVFIKLFSLINIVGLHKTADTLSLASDRVNSTYFQNLIYSTAIYSYIDSFWHRIALSISYHEDISISIQ